MKVFKAEYILRIKTKIKLTKVLLLHKKCIDYEL